MFVIWRERMELSMQGSSLFKARTESINASRLKCRVDCITVTVSQLCRIKELDDNQ